ncbi:probable isoprenylcysteine alpha-carbonyl methylesterase ICMEL1 isoform X2 [Elaeis guineensis]|uniref:protein-S-isoprenylcysteine alpha-carbonyl methylesterase n=1 Tax=Elaeis guineensis var. tenera TaxID=51953 RepID=A0A6J0PQW5_ELAGV|nr:probable isoprenylcysteine alpha-carbonyl methylesterase ICMEL1 isoform X2 [Elaeis guineensis]
MAVHLPGCTALRVRGLFGLATCQLLRRMEMESRLFVSPLQTPGGPVEDGKALALAAAAFSSSSSSSSLSVSVAEDANVERPLIRRVPSAASSSGSRRRRASIDLSSASRRPSFRQEVERAAAETYLVTRLAFTLLRYLGVGYRWITKFIALGCYALLLMPGFLQVGYYYFFSSQVRRSVVYGEQPRNRLDLYLPVNTDGLKPAVAFVTGGAWIIGYKAWGALLGRRLAERGVIVACIDYRNFPQGTIGDMVKDASQGISFVCNNIASYGGDPNRIYLIGQSAGAHIAACALLDQAIGESGEGESISWSVSQIKAYFGISGGYNMLNLVDHFHRRGLYRSIFLSIMEGEQSLQRFSPEAMVQGSRVRHAVSLLPRVILFHGTSDYSIPSDASKTFADALQNAGAQAELVLYEGKTHTDLFLQDPFRGGKDELLEDIIAVVHADDAAALANDGAAPAARRLVPECMLQLASKISPF